MPPICSPTMAATLPPRDESSDYDSSCSSITVPDSSRSWMSNPSFGSRRSSISVSSSAADTYFSLLSRHKPHKANQAAWEAVRKLQCEKGGRVGLDQFRLLRRLGSGDIGNVYLCQIRSSAVAVGLPAQCLYAMKVVDREALALRKKLQRAEMEKEILGMLDHPFLPTLYAEFDASHYSCLLMEFCPGGDLLAARQRQPTKRFSISSAKFYGAETLLALEYLHMMGIVYRDLKPENVLMREDGHIMLSDFDLSLKCDVVPKLVRRSKPDQETSNDNKATQRCSTPSCAIPVHPVLSCFSTASRRSKPSSAAASATTRTITVRVDGEEVHYDPELVAEPINARSKSFVGTHEYLAPEVISGQGHGSAVDWWTFGVFLYELLYGKTPFKGENNEKTLINILKQPLSFPRIGVSTRKDYEEMVKVQDLISRLLVKNPKRRIGSSKGSVEIKRHEFFNGVNWALIRSVRPPEVPAGELQRVRSRAAAAVMPKLSKKERDAPYQIPHHFDYF
ncbi:Protein kinase PINOID [Sarracenia purpurea var. burkii]